MRKKLIFAGMVLILAFSSSAPSSGQSLLKKLKDRAEDEVVNKVFGPEQKNTPTQGNSQDASVNETSTGSSMSNTRGEGITSTPPDVRKNIAGAETAYRSGDLSGARYAVRQAILGLEMEIGRKVLDDLPESVKGIKMVSEEDRVSSMSIGFEGLTIERVYRSDEQELSLIIGNDAALLSAVSLFMASGAYGTSTDQNHKEVEFQGKHGVLEYDEYSGYTLSVPFGQSSIFIAKGINFSNENEIMEAAGEINLNKIMKNLGEQ